MATPYLISNMTAKNDNFSASSSYTWTFDLGVEGVDWEPGDFAIAFIGANTNTNTFTPSAKTGWTLSSTISQGAANPYQHLAYYYRFLPTGYGTQVTFSRNAAGSDSGGMLLIFRGVDPTTPFDVTPVVSQITSANKTGTSPSITTTTNECCIVRFMQAGFAGNSPSYPDPLFTTWAGNESAGMGDRFGGRIDQGGSDVGIAAWITDKPTAGATGTATVESLSTATPYPKWNCVTFALRPASSGTPVRYDTNIYTDVAEGESWYLEVLSGYIDRVEEDGDIVGSFWNANLWIFRDDEWQIVALYVKVQSAIATFLVADTVLVGDTVEAFVSPTFGNNITKAVFDGGDEIVVSGGDTEFGDIVLPGIEEFVSAGSMEHTRLASYPTELVEYGGTVDVYLATADTTSSPASLRVFVPEDYYLVTLEDDTSPMAVAASASIGDDLLVWGDDVVAVDTSGYVTFANGTGTANFRVFDVVGKQWGADLTYTKQAIVPSTQELAVAGTFAYTLTPADEIPTSLTLGGVALAVTGATVDGDTSVSMPSIADFMSGAFNAVPWYQSVPLIAGFATAEDAETDVFIVGPTGANYFSGVVGNSTGGEFTLIPEGTPWFAEVTQGTASVTDQGISGSFYEVDLYTYEGGAWGLYGTYQSEDSYSANFRRRALPAALDSYFVRGSDATSISKAGVYSVVGSGVPAWDGTDGLILEASATNYVRRSNSVGTTPWVTSGLAGITSGISTPVGPIGFLVETTDPATGSSQISSQFPGTLTSSVTRCVSAIFKYVSGSPWIRFMYYDGGGNQCRAWVDLETGTLGTVSNGGSATGTAARIRALGDGFYEIQVSGAHNGAATGYFQVNVQTGNSSTTAAVGSYIIAAPQGEDGAFATSYIPTEGSTVTRAAAYIGNVPLNELGLLEKTNDYSFHLVWKAPADESSGSGTSSLMSLTNAANTEWLYLQWGTTQGLRLFKRSGAGGDDYTNFKAWTGQAVVNIRGKVSATGGVKLWVDDLAVTDNPDVTAFSAPLTQLMINNISGSSIYSRGTYRGIRIWDYALSDAELEALSAEDFLAGQGYTPGQWVQSVTDVTSVNDAWMEFLAGEGYTTGSLNDRMMAWLGDEGYTGALSDRLAAWSLENLIQYQE